VRGSRSSQEFFSRVFVETEESSCADDKGSIHVTESELNAGGEWISGGGGNTWYLAMKLSTSRRAEMLEAGSGGHDDEDNDGDSTQRPQHGHPTSHEHLVIVCDVTSAAAAPAGLSALRYAFITAITSTGNASNSYFY